MPNLILIKKFLGLTMAIAFSVAFTACESNNQARINTSATTTYRTGDTVTVLPRGYRTVDIDGRSYYYARGTYYQPRGSTYVVVNRPLTTRTYTYGTRSDRLPSRYNRVRYGNRDYYYSNGTYYRSRNGAYVTVRDPFGY